METKKHTWFAFFLLIVCAAMSCRHNAGKKESRTVAGAGEILGNPDYLAISYGGYRQNTREAQPTVQELKDDMLILSAMGIGLLRTYNVHLSHAANLLKAIHDLKTENPGFEMYVMLGAWIDCKNAWTDLPPVHNEESARNEREIKRAVELANQYPDIVKIIAVGNEAMVKWAEAYYVEPWIILKWARHLQALKASGELPKSIWITSSDNFASWGGGDPAYHVEELNELIRTVDFISMHTYPMHDTHYNPAFWGNDKTKDSLSKEARIKLAMGRALDYAKGQYNGVKAYVDSLGAEVPIHIGETGWASMDSENGLYGKLGSKATDEYKSGIYYRSMRDWTNSEGIACFYFEAFDEPWKDAQDAQGSENHFGLFTVDGQAKYAIWELVDWHRFEGLSRNGNKIVKTHGGQLEALIAGSPLPPITKPIGL